jgi:hypothetical protein
MPSPYELKTRWLEWHEGLLDLDEKAIRKLLAQIPTSALLDELDRRLEELRHRQQSTPPAPKRG